MVLGAWALAFTEHDARSGPTPDLNGGRVSDAYDESRHLPDAKVTKIIDWIAENQCPGVARNGEPASAGATWTDVRVIIFTEWDASLTYLRNQLSSAIAGTDNAEARIEIFRGSTGSDRREAVKAAFNAPPETHPVRILIATDAAREGLNLQAHCQHLFHYDVPWNPARLEQRNGRIDRKLQPKPEVFCHYFFYHQRSQDRVLNALVRKTDTIQNELGSLSQVLDNRLTKKLEHGIDAQKVSQLITSFDEEETALVEERAIATEELEEIRLRQDALRDQVRYLENRISDARRWINYSDAAFEQALSCSLTLANHSPLESVQTDQEDGTTYRFPSIHTEQGLDPTWGPTLDSLRQPPANGKRDHRWRSESPIRPVRFTPPEGIDDSTVQLHLGHRIAKRLLSRFLSQGFVHHDMSRACLGQSDDAIPRVVLIGRLGLFGSGATRLHEEIVTITARWEPIEKRNGSPLSAYARDAEARTMEILEKSLLSDRSDLPSQIRDKLLSSIEGDLADLRPLLNSRAEDAKKIARQRLNERAEAEVKDIERILTNQKKRVEASLQKHESSGHEQLSLGFNDEEKRQLDLNRKSWRKWLENVNQDLINEPARIRDFYQVELERIEPIGLVYLWPSQT